MLSMELPFSSVDPDRLALAVYLAKQDVTRMNSSVRVVPSRPATSPTCRNTAPLPCCRSPNKFPSTQLVRPPNVVPRSRSNDPRMHSPPTRDPGPVSFQARARPLHAPTERRLQSAQESRLRQLQSKIERYSSALALLRQQARMKSASNILEDPVALTSDDPIFPRPKLPSATSKRVQTRKPQKGVLKPSLSMLRSSSARSTGLQPSRRRMKQLGKSCDARVGKKSSEPAEMDSQKIASFIWKKTMQRVCDADIVYLKPQEHSALIGENVTQKPHQHAGELRASNCKTVSFVESQARSTQSMSADQADSSAPACQPLSSTVVCYTNEASSRALQLLDEAEHEEESIRRRWAHLSLQPASPNPGARSICAYETRTHGASSTNLTSPPEFDRSTVDQPCIAVDNTCIQKSVASKNIPEAFAIPSHRTFRLPTSVHRSLLTEARDRHSQLKTSSSIVDGSSPVTFCQSLTDDLLDSLLDDVVAEVERETSELVNALVMGELYSDMPDSSISIHSAVDSDVAIRATPIAHHDPSSVRTPGPMYPTSPPREDEDAAPSRTQQTTQYSSTFEDTSEDISARVSELSAVSKAPTVSSVEQIAQAALAFSDTEISA